MAKTESRRIQRVSREIQQVVAQYLSSGFKHPLQGLVTVSDIEPSNDLRQAKVHVSTMGSKEEAAENLKTLNQYAFEFQSQISQQIRMKFCPKLKFYSDEKHQRAMKVQQLIDQVSQENRQNEEESE
jgi:ribosome-binding factor A